MSKPKVFFCWTLNSGTTFYRMMNPMKYMRKQIAPGLSKWSPDFQGVAEWEYKMDEPLVQKDVAFLLDNCDMVIAQKFHWYGGLSVLNAFRAQYPNKPFMTELDDHVFALNACSPASESYYAGSEAEDIVKEQIQGSTGIITSTEYLRSVFEKINPNVWVVPNGIDFQVWDKLKNPVRKSKKIRIGWAGGGSHLDDLEFIEPAISKIIKKYTNVEFVFLGGVHPCFKDRSKIKAISKWFPINEYPQAIRDLDLDIALAPLRDNVFNRGKSNLRWLEYSALKIPTVASNVEPFKCIENGKDGFLVTEIDEWEMAISALIEHESKRKQMGLNAYSSVKEKFNIEIISQDYVRKIKHMLAGKINISKDAIIGAMSE